MAEKLSQDGFEVLPLSSLTVLDGGLLEHTTVEISLVQTHFACTCDDHSRPDDAVPVHLSCIRQVSHVTVDTCFKRLCD